MDILGSKIWLWVNAIGLILVGAISLVPELVPTEFGIPLSIVKIIVAFLTLLSAFWESDDAFPVVKGMERTVWR